MLASGVLLKQLCVSLFLASEKLDFFADDY